MIANLTEYFRGPEFVQKYLKMILHHILKPGQIGSGQKKDISDLAKKLFETYVPAASTLRIFVKKCKTIESQIGNKHLMFTKTFYLFFCYEVSVSGFCYEVSSQIIVIKKCVSSKIRHIIQSE